jgi:hypothetical protein
VISPLYKGTLERLLIEFTGVGRAGVRTHLRSPSGLKALSRVGGDSEVASEVGGRDDRVGARVNVRF